MKQIEPCPEIWGWKEIPPKDLSVYIEAENYGYICLVFHPYLPITYIHGMPYNGYMPKLKHIINIHKKIQHIVKFQGIQFIVCSYDEQPRETTKKLITKHLGFYKVNNLTYMKYMGD